MLPPGIPEVAIRHSTFPSSSSRRRSTQTYLPFVPFSSIFASSSSADRSMGMETIILRPQHWKRSEDSDGKMSYPDLGVDLSK